MKRLFRVYKFLFYINYLNLIIYRGNFISSLFSSTLWGVFSIVSILLLTSRTTTLFGWSKQELILLTASYSILIGIFHTFFSHNFEQFARIVDRGQLDSFLIKPFDPQLAMTISRINYPSAMRIILGIAVMGYLLFSMHITVTAYNLFVFMLMLLCGTFLLYSIWFILTTLTIWVPRLTNIVDLLYTINNVSRYPPDMFRELSYFVFVFLLPLTIVVATPTKILLTRFTINDVLLLPTLTVFFLFLSRKFWQFALKHYTSASS